MGLVGAHVPDASACEPLPPPTLPEPCVNVRVYVPGSTFPLNLADTGVSVWTESYDGTGYAMLPHDPALTVVVARATDGGFEIVPHTRDALRVLITDPVPGTYVIASAAQTCDAEPASFTEGSVRATFELTDEVPLPDELGAVAWLGRTLGPEVVYLGQDGECRDVTRIDWITHNRFELSLSDASAPWADALRFGIEIDGEQVHGFGEHEFVDPRTVAFDYAVTCPAGDEISPGKHTLRFLGKVDGTVIASAPVDFTFSCRGAGASGSWSPGVGSAGGCSVRTTGTAGPSGALALMVLLVLGASRARSRL